MVNLDIQTGVNKAIDYVFHGKIVEYDMRAASLQISDRFKLLPVSKIEELKRMTKDERVKEVGICQRDIPGYSEKLLQHIREVRRHFIETNKVEDDQIIALHNDALFINSLQPFKLIVDGIEFTEKTIWTSYIRFENIEMFYNNDTGQIEYKGVSSKTLPKHEIGMCKHILKVFNMIENNDERTLDYITDYQTKYLKGQLNENCYIPFANVSGQQTLENMKLLAFLCMIAIKECN